MAAGATPVKGTAKEPNAEAVAPLGLVTWSDVSALAFCGITTQNTLPGMLDSPLSRTPNVMVVPVSTSTSGVCTPVAGSTPNVGGSGLVVVTPLISVGAACTFTTGQARPSMGEMSM